MGGVEGQDERGIGGGGGLRMTMSIALNWRGRGWVCLPVAGLPVRV